MRAILGAVLLVYWRLAVHPLSVLDHEQIQYLSPMNAIIPNAVYFLAGLTWIHWFDPRSPTDRSKLANYGVFAACATVIASQVPNCLIFVLPLTLPVLILWWAYKPGSRQSAVGSRNQQARGLEPPQHRGAAANTQRRQRTDLSYGLYLYGFPVQRLLIQYTPALRRVANGGALPHPFLSLFLFLSALLLTIPLAWLSWHLVENPAQRIGRRS